MKRARTLACSLVGMLLTACHSPEPAEARRSAEAARIARQMAGLRKLIAKTEAGETHADEVMIGIKAAVVGEFIEAGLPLERVVAGRFRVRAEKAEAIFKSSQSRIVLHGRVSAIDSPALFADVRLTGGLERLEIDPATEILTARIALQDLEVQRVAGGADNAFVKSALEALGREDLESLEALLPPVVIPIRIDESVSVSGPGDGPLTMVPGRLPVRASVTSVVPIRDRLWVTLLLVAGPWERLPPAKAAPDRSPGD